MTITITLTEVISAVVGAIIWNYIGTPIKNWIKSKLVPTVK